MKTVIMAGGKGTRISELFPNIPKPMIPISSDLVDENGGNENISCPVLEWEIRSLVAQGFKDIIITVSYMADKIEGYFGSGERFGCSITYFVEDIPLGNAGALFKLRDKLGNDPFLLINADAVFDVNFQRMVDYHINNRALVTLFTHPNNHPYDSGVIVTDHEKKVVRWLTKEDSRPEWYKNRVNAGLHIINPNVLDLIASHLPYDLSFIGKKDEKGIPRHVDLDRHILKPLCGTGSMIAYDSPEYCKDMGTPERYLSVCKDFRNGVVYAKNLMHPQRAIFIDRDGTINRYVGFLRNIDDFELLKGVSDAIKLINASGYLCIVVTNQPVVARGEVTREQLNEIHNKMETLLGQAGAYIDGLYYCPHHPNSGFDGEIKELKFDCDCRKPKPGMLMAASKDFNIDLSASWMIGDGINDVKAGKAAGCKTILIGESVVGCNPDFIAKDLKSAIEVILD